MERILIVDDNSKNIQVLATVLAKNNYEVEYALRGKDAIEIVKSEDFELILLDIMMPELDGFDTCVALKKIEGKQDIPVIFITAKTDIESITKGFELGGVDYITKPFNDRELLKRIETHIELKKSQEKLKEVNIWLEKQVQERTKELISAKEELERANTELTKMDAAKTNILSLISQEIRTPLNGITSFLYLLKKQNKIEGLDKYINPLDLSVQKLEDFTNKALMLTELSSAGSEQFEKRELNIRELILFAVNNLTQKINNKGLTVDIDHLAENHHINGDDTYLVKSFEFVIDNAIDFSPDNSEIKINSRMAENEIIFEIIDNGDGFSEEALNNLEKSFRSENTLGISLAIVKKVMEKHNGYLAIKNLEIGSSVSFHFKK
ncbi:MAG: hybrid sensor histidine kinase/response regulator [Chloroflexia bacterium]|nr:hybrid sensor histidine kinase/response regulator [Chloroflexia bacterium]